MSASQPIARRPDDFTGERERYAPTDAEGAPELSALSQSASVDWGNDRSPVAPHVPEVEPSRAARFSARTSAPREAAALPIAPIAPSPKTSGSIQRAGAWSTFRWMALLGAIGLVVGGAGGAVFAFRMGYDLRLALEIGALVGIAGGAAGMTIPPLARALGWAMLAGSLGAVATGALWLLTRVAPALVDRVIHWR